MKTDSIIRTRINAETKEKAMHALKEMGITASDAIRLLMTRIAEEKKLPFEVKVPNAATQQAMNELNAGKGKKVSSLSKLMADLHEND
ncbi:type II toxin-antitoxin system RelB/DinJ family antitoxin [Entomobacter blattae]|uniref:RelB antitoxin n=1 Tax=Entomobacter blattae TaxID=2762277 RepID=A0A7H1NTT3_9PROT|nr:type II toxin-antitoxin system RelB/DinJ family antitoxin [Entomobacter blattae]QNT79193.1 RelB antitoxin [Entomobacter blattae]